ncbi:MAG: hypothetical protein LAN62_06315 [Acidobacteriia bacterium]|nr:hypothetical protein [Terriglobia bacterium]
MSRWLVELIRYINRKDWWHVPPVDPRAYEKRGKFLAWSFGAAEFYGRPLDQPVRVYIQNPLVGDEPTVERALFGREINKDWPDGHVIQQRLALDAKMRRVALRKGYDSIVMMSTPRFRTFATLGKVPRPMELNILRPVTCGRCGHKRGEGRSSV